MPNNLPIQSAHVCYLLIQRTPLQCVMYLKLIHKIEPCKIQGSITNKNEIEDKGLHYFFIRPIRYYECKAIALQAHITYEWKSTILLLNSHRPRPNEYNVDFSETCTSK